MTDTNKPLLQVSSVVKTYSSDDSFLGKLSGTAKRIPALNNVSLELREGEVMGLIGESGSGKSALGKIIAGLEKPDSGSVVFMEKLLSSATEAEVTKARRYLRYIGEDNFAGLSADPKNRMDNLLYKLVDKYPGENGKKGGRDLANELLEKVGLNTDYLNRFVSQVSGGERQRFAIARALATRPRLVVADEPVSNLDLNTRTEVLNLMRRMGREAGTAFLFISHNPSMVRYFAGAGRTAIMFGGRIVEIIPTSQLFSLPTHPYTRTLLNTNAAPSPLPGSALDPAVALAETEQFLEDDSSLSTLESESSDLSLKGNVSAAAQLVAAKQPGCVFYRWCPERIDICKKESPKLAKVVRRPVPGTVDGEAIPTAELEPQHVVACVHYGEGSV